MIIYYKYIIFILSIEYVISENNYKDINWKCADPDCSKIISEGTASMKYQYPNYPGKIKFNTGDEFEIYKKSKDFLYGKLKTGDNKGEIGIISSKLIKETKTFLKDNKLVDEKKHNLETQNDPKTNWNTQLNYEHESTEDVLKEETNHASNIILDPQTEKASKSGTTYNAYDFLSKKRININPDTAQKSEQKEAKNDQTENSTDRGPSGLVEPTKSEQESNNNHIESLKSTETSMQQKDKVNQKETSTKDPSILVQDAKNNPVNPKSTETGSIQQEDMVNQKEKFTEDPSIHVQEAKNNLLSPKSTETGSMQQEDKVNQNEKFIETPIPASLLEAKNNQTEIQNSTGQVRLVAPNTEQETNNKQTESPKLTENVPMQQEDIINQKEKYLVDPSIVTSTPDHEANKIQNSIDQPLVNVEQEINNKQTESQKSTENVSMQQEHVKNEKSTEHGVHTSSPVQEAKNNQNETQNFTDQSVPSEFVAHTTLNAEQEINHNQTDPKSTEETPMQQNVNQKEKSTKSPDHTISPAEANQTESHNSTDQSVDTASHVQQDMDDSNHIYNSTDQSVDTVSHVQQDMDDSNHIYNSTDQSVDTVSHVQQDMDDSNHIYNSTDQSVDTASHVQQNMDYSNQIYNSTETIPVPHDEQSKDEKPNLEPNNSNDTKLEEINKNQQSTDQSENLKQIPSEENKADFNQFSQANETNQNGVNYSTEFSTSKLNNVEGIELSTKNDVQTPEEPNTFTPNLDNYSSKTSNEIEIQVHKQVDKYSPELQDFQNDENLVQDDPQKIIINNETPEIVNESDTIDDKKLENDSTMFSGVYSIMQSLQDMLYKSPLPSKQETPEFKETPELKEALEIKETHDIINKQVENIQEDIQPQYAEYQSETCTIESSWMSLKTICLLGFTSIVILIFSLGYYYMDNSKRDFELVTKNNELASELFILQKERAVLEERLQSAEEKANQNSGEASKYTYEVDSLNSELNQMKNEKLQLDEREQNLIKKCSMLETNYAKLRQMLSESKQKGERSILIADIKKLKESSTTEILKLKEQLDIKSEEGKTLMVKLAKANELKDRLEEKLNMMMSEEQIAVKHYQDSVSKLEQMIEDSKATVIKLEDEVGKLKKDNESLIIEKELAETSLQKAHGLKSSESLSAWLQSKEIQIALVKTVKNLEELELKYNQLLNEKTSLSDKEKSLQIEFEELNEKYEQAEKAKIEALTKLQVLSDYFNEKETQLQEELGTKEALWLQKQSDDHTIYEQMRTLREENQTFKNQNETLKKEIIDQETSYKKLISSAEEKADGYWVSLRQAERRLKETQIEAAQLRNRLTAIETSEISDDKKTEVNGDMPYGPATSPPFMLYPSEFIPPPPLIPTTPSRPPPLGRISSPTLGDFTPPLPLPPFDLYPPSPPPPPPSHYVHKPQPRETRKQKDSQSSNHSSESTDKMHRRTKR